MVKDEQKWIRLFKKYKRNELEDRLRFQLADLENFIKARLGGASFLQSGLNIFHLQTAPGALLPAGPFPLGFII